MKRTSLNTKLSDSSISASKDNALSPVGNCTPARSSKSLKSRIFGRFTGNKSIQSRLARFRRLSSSQRQTLLRNYALRPYYTLMGLLQKAIDKIYFVLHPLMNLSPIRHAVFVSTPKDQDLLLAELGYARLLVHSGDRELSRDVYSYGNTEFRKAETAFRILKEKHYDVETFIDVGANIGNICIPVLKRGFAKKAIAIEPEPTNFRVLSANLLINDLVEVTQLHNVALGRGDSKVLDLALSDFNFGDHRVFNDSCVSIANEPPRKLVQVPAETFDSVVNESDLSNSLVWMDTQGYEGVILQGAKKVLAAKPPMVIEFWPYGMQWTGCYQELREAILGYTIWYDLSIRKPSAELISGESIDELFARLANIGEYGSCDLLLFSS